MFLITSNYLYLCKWIILMLFHAIQGVKLTEKVQRTNAKLEEWNSYPALNDYYSLDYAPVRPCRFSCSASGFTTIQAEMLSSSFNSVLDLSAAQHNFSNVYRLDWNNYLAEIAKAKSIKCLPPTYENDEKKYVLYDEQTLSKYVKRIFGLVVEGASLEVVIGRRKIARGEETLADRDLSMVQYYTNLFFKDPSHFESRVLSIAMGCGYLVETTYDGYFDQMLCMFGPIFKNAKNEPLIGRGCSDCTFFSQMQFDGMHPMWNCDLKFTNLCSDLSRNEKIDDLYSLYNCTDQGPSLAPIDDKTKPPRVEQPQSSLPCLPIFIPLTLIAILFFALCIYNVGTALIFKKNSEK